MFLAGGALLLIGIIGKQINPHLCAGLGNNAKVPIEGICVCSFTAPLPVGVAYPTKSRPLWP
eukprot:scaffold3438_cov64-Attheya_sp.AAC.2